MDNITIRLALRQIGRARQSWEIPAAIFISEEGDCRLCMSLAACAAASSAAAAAAAALSALAVAAAAIAASLTARFCALSARHCFRFSSKSSS